MPGLSWFFKVPEGADSPLWCEARTPFALMQQCRSYQLGKLAKSPLPAVRNNLADLVSVLTAHQFGGFRHDHCTVLLDHAGGDAVIRALYDNAHRATDTLLVYFAGHGLPGPRSKELYLTLANTDPDDALWWRGALGYDEIRRVLLDHCRADNRVVILDCCFSGRAIPETAGADTAGAFDIRGTYTLAAVGENQFAYAPPGDAHTAFTGELLKVLRDGVPHAPELLSLNTVYLELVEALASRDLHRPRQNNNDTVAGLALTRNPAYGHNEGRKRPRPRRTQRGASTGLSLTATPVASIRTKVVYSLAFSPDGGSLAVATGASEVQVFDTTSWRPRLVVLQHWRGAASVFTVAFSPSGYEFATGGSAVDGGMVRLWYTNDGGRGRKIAHDAAVWAVAFSPDGEWLATGDSDGTVQIWKPDGGKPVMRFAHLDRVHGLAFGSDRRKLATGSADRTARIWDTYTGEQKIMFDNKYGNTMAFSSDGRLLATASTPAHIWDAHTGTELFTLSPESGSSERICHDVAFHPDGRFLAAVYPDHTARIWDTHTGTELLKLTHDHEVRAVAFSPDGHLLATGDGQRQGTIRRGPGTVHVWQLKVT
jgi:WD40 repeat protein